MPIIPTVIENVGRHERAMDVYSSLLDNRIIFLQGEVEDHMAQTICAQLLYLSYKDKKKDINLYVNSPGGSVSAGLAIIDTMSIIPNDVSTVSMGMVASMGSLIAQAGAKNKRYILPNAEHLLHQPMSGLRSGTQQTDFEIHAQHLKRTRDRLTRIYQKHNSKGKTFEEIHVAIERDNILSAEESLDFGVSDKIIMSVD